MESSTQLQLRMAKASNGARVLHNATLVHMYGVKWIIYTMHVYVDRGISVNNSNTMSTLCIQRWNVNKHVDTREEVGASFRKNWKLLDGGQMKTKRMARRQRCGIDDAFDTLCKWHRIMKFAMPSVPIG